MINTVRTSCEPAKKNIKPNIILLMTLLLIGVLIGTLAFCNMSQDDFNNFSFITQMFIKKKSEQTFLQSLINSFSTSASLLLICFFLGFSFRTSQNFNLGNGQVFSNGQMRKQFKMLKHHADATT